jgi:hypothetical protein
VRLAYAIGFSIIGIIYPIGKVKIEWTPKFAYAVGLLATDGNLSKDGRHMNMTSKDKEQVELFKECLGLKNKIGLKTRGGSNIKKYFQVQFGDVIFYDFLMGIGLKPAKSKTLQRLAIPTKYFADFFRGCIDGDGNINISNHPESKRPQLRIRLFSASLPFIRWILEEIHKNTDIQGGWLETSKDGSISRLSFGKSDSLKIFSYIYYPGVSCYLDRKYSMVEKFNGRVAELV